MARYKDHQKALELRKQGKSYSQIKSILKVGKGTLSAWLHNYPLSKERIRELRDWNEQRIENYRETRRKQREAIFNQIYKIEKKKLLPLTKRDIFIAGLFLYWGEGTKTRISDASLSNTNPAIIKTFIHWLENSFDINRSKLKIRLQLYKDMNSQKEIAYWSKILHIPLSQFRKPYIKKSNWTEITYKNPHIHGTCNVIIGNAMVSKRIIMELKVIDNYFNGLVA